MSETLSKPSVPFFPGTYVDMNHAMLATGKPRETIRRWCVDDGIGRQRPEWGNGWKWEISLPALRMRIANDRDAFTAYCGGDTKGPLVKSYMVGIKVLTNG